MKLVGTMAVRNEAYILGLSLRVALMWCDAVVVLLHACTDRSQEILEEVIRENERGRVIVLHESNPIWDEMPQRQMMLEAARRNGATHIAITDADEVLTGNLLESARELHTKVWGLTMMVQLPLYYMRGSIMRYHSNGIWGNRWTDVAFRDDLQAHWGGDCYHARAPRGVKWAPYQPIAQGQGGVLHMWGCSERRLRAKSALYKVVERLRWPEKPVQTIDRMYSWAICGDSHEARFGTPATWTYATTPAEWWTPYAHLLKHLDLDVEPWQEGEVQRLVGQHGAATFAGLDLFGVV